MSTNKCVRCGSERIIPEASISDYAHYNSKRDLSVEIAEKPLALIFTGMRKGSILATICADCGHAELTVTNAQELYEAYQKQLLA